MYVCIYVSLSHSFAVSLRGQYLLYSVFVVHFDRFDVLCIALPFCMVYAAQRGFCFFEREREREREREIHRVLRICKTVSSQKTAMPVTKPTAMHLYYTHLYVRCMGPTWV